MNPPRPKRWGISRQTGYNRVPSAGMKAAEIKANQI